MTDPKAIVALIQACIEQPEYAKKSFGVISLLGDEQAKIIQQLIEKELDPKETMQRHILCGNSANFQGDERDVVFLSLVDSGNDDGPNHLLTFGPEDSYRKRYNVAASRARDQLWVVDSLDPANDLKPGDLRKRLIEYSINPQSMQQRELEIEQAAESPFESSVAKALSNLGYHLELQRKVGAYRLDIVAVCGEKTVAIECDGERWHSGEAKIREDMERQTILERLGWRFIRIRGSEYYRDPPAAIERVVASLKHYGIEPESVHIVETSGRETELLNRVKKRAFELLEEKKENDQAAAKETIEFALGSFDKYAEEYARRNAAVPSIPSTTPKRNTSVVATKSPPPAQTQAKGERESEQPVKSASAQTTSIPAKTSANAILQEPTTVSQKRAVAPPLPTRAASEAAGSRFITITWDVDGKKTKQQVQKGIFPEKPTPEKTPDANGHYVFISWDSAIKLAKTDTTYTAVFRREPHRWGKEIIIREPTTSNNGRKICTCDVCGYAGSFDIPRLKENWVFDGFSWFNTASGEDVYALATFRNRENANQTQTVIITPAVVSVKNTGDRSIERTYKVTINAKESLDGRVHSELKAVSKQSGTSYKKQSPEKAWDPPQGISESAFRDYLRKAGFGKEKADTYVYRKRLAHFYAQENIDPSLSLDVDDLALINKTIDSLLADPRFLKDNAARRGAYIEALKLFRDFAAETLTPGKNNNYASIKQATILPNKSAAVLSEKKAPPRPEKPQDFHVGDRVRHNTFGIGRIIRIEPGYVTIAFDSAGERKLDLKLCLEKKILSH